MVFHWRKPTNTTTFEKTMQEDTFCKFTMYGQKRDPTRLDQATLQRGPQNVET